MKVDNKPTGSERPGGDRGGKERERWKRIMLNTELTYGPYTPDLTTSHYDLQSRSFFASYIPDMKDGRNESVTYFLHG